MRTGFAQPDRFVQGCARLDRVFNLPKNVGNGTQAEKSAESPEGPANSIEPDLRRTRSCVLLGHLDCSPRYEVVGS
jgi:hypothetical protein